MRICHPSTSPRRSGATLVEAAFIISIALLFLLGIFEYARFVMVNHLLESSAREAARLAVVHTNDMTDTDIKNEVTRRLVGLDTNIEGKVVDVYGVVLRNGTKNQKIANWTDTKITDGVVVEIKGKYRPLLPNFLNMPSTFDLHAKAVMYSEAN